MTLFTKSEMKDFQDRFDNYYAGDINEFIDELIRSNYNKEEIAYILRNIEID